WWRRRPEAGCGGFARHGAPALLAWLAGGASRKRALSASRFYNEPFPAHFFCTRCAYYWSKMTT
ncbi:hypothetical protein, partial [Ralstonia pseudosolanacearum]|uniref:hypothetical protein n=1 Tax=Ralstonia pseudosolanacearum TaxID=1310165 RepID=UPI003CFB1F07